MKILQILIRILLILVFIGIFIFLSITLFKYIPKAINQLASATLSLSEPTSSSTVSVASTTDRTPVPVSPTSDGLNGSVGGDIVILDTPVSQTKTPSVPTTQKPQTIKQTYTTYQPVTYSGRKNLSVVLARIGIIDKNTGTFIQTNSFKSTDTVSVQATIVNNEDTPTGPWSVRVEMPAQNTADQIRQVANAASIPGQGYTNIEARFDGINLSNGTPVVRIYVDTNNQVSETNENDNVLSVPLTNVQSNGNGSYTGGSTNLRTYTLETGRMYGTVFSPTTSFNFGEKITVRARIQNTGASFTNTWSTRLVMTSSNTASREFNTANEQPIRSGDESIFYYTVDNLTRGSQTFTLTVDSQYSIAETNEGDNITSTSAYIN